MFILVLSISSPCSVVDAVFEAFRNLNLPFSHFWAIRPPHPDTHTPTYTHKVGVLICPTDSAVSETGCQREGIYYRIDLAMQLGGNGNFSFHFSLSNTSLWGTLKKGWSDVLWWLAEEQKKAGLWAEGKGKCVVLVLWQMSGHFYSMEEQKWNSTWLSPSIICSFSLPVICNRIKVQNKNKLAILILVKNTFWILNLENILNCCIYTTVWLHPSVTSDSTSVCTISNSTILWMPVTGSEVRGWWGIEVITKRFTNM